MEVSNFSLSVFLPSPFVLHEPSNSPTTGALRSVLRVPGHFVTLQSIECVCFCLFVFFPVRSFESPVSLVIVIIQHPALLASLSSSGSMCAGLWRQRCLGWRQLKVIQLHLICSRWFSWDLWYHSQLALMARSHVTLLKYYSGGLRHWEDISDLTLRHYWNNALTLAQRQESWLPCWMFYPQVVERKLWSVSSEQGKNQTN